MGETQGVYRKNGKTVENKLWKWKETVENCFNRQTKTGKGCKTE